MSMKELIFGNYDYKSLLMPTHPWSKKQTKMQFFGRDDKTPLLVSFLMGLQHAFAMVGGLITPPYVIIKFTVALNPASSIGLQQYMISAALIVSGLCTILNCVQIKIPMTKYVIGTGVLSVVGTSFTFLPIFENAVNMMKGECLGPGSTCDGLDGNPFVPSTPLGACHVECREDAYGSMLGTVMVCCFLEVFLSFVPPKTLKKLFPSVVTGITVMLIGVQLAATGLKYWGGGAVCADMAWKSHEDILKKRAGPFFGPEGHEHYKTDSCYGAEGVHFGCPDAPEEDLIMNSANSCCPGPNCTLSSNVPKWWKDESVTLCGGQTSCMAQPAFSSVTLGPIARNTFLPTVMSPDSPVNTEDGTRHPGHDYADWSSPNNFLSDYDYCDCDVPWERPWCKGPNVVGGGVMWTFVPDKVIRHHDCGSGCTMGKTCNDLGTVHFEDPVAFPSPPGSATDPDQAGKQLDDGPGALVKTASCDPLGRCAIESVGCTAAADGSDWDWEAETNCIPTGSVTGMMGAGYLGGFPRFKKDGMAYVGGMGACPIVNFPNVPDTGCSGNGDTYLNFGAPEYVGLGFSVMAMLLLIELFGSTFMKNCNVIIALLFGYMVAGASEKCRDIYTMSESGETLKYATQCLQYVTSDKIDSAKAIDFLWTKSFNIGFYGPAVFPVIICFIVTTVETIGDIGATYDASSLPQDGEDFPASIQGGLLSDGICSFFAALATSMPNTTFSQNNGVIALTKCASRRAGIAAGCILLFMGVFSKISGVITSIPDSVLGGMTTFLFTQVLVSGVGVVAKCDMQSRRNRVIMGVSLGIGVGVSAVPYIFGDFRGSGYTSGHFWPCHECSNAEKGVRDGVILFLITPYCSGTVLAFLLNLILPNDPIVVSDGDAAKEGDEKPATGGDEKLSAPVQPV